MQPHWCWRALHVAKQLEVWSRPHHQSEAIYLHRIQWSLFVVSVDTNCISMCRQALSRQISHFLHDGGIVILPELLRGILTTLAKDNFLSTSYACLVQRLQLNVAGLTMISKEFTHVIDAIVDNDMQVSFLVVFGDLFYSKGLHDLRARV